jgi:tetratricopeptide (TPR) repeat protein
VSQHEEPTRIEGSTSSDEPRPIGMLSRRYRVLALIGVGGMGSVYLADDLELGERVAVKMLRPGCSNAEFIERLRSEVRLARRVTHKNVARTYDIGEHEGERFLTMEYIDGESLDARIARDGALALPLFFRVANDVAAGLAAAHAAGVVHRDLKPPNILVAHDGRAVITDFGLAWSGDTQPEDRVAGTPSYMAPEQFDGKFDERSDVFALGVVFHVMLTAEKPFAAAPSERPTRAPNPRDVRPNLPIALGALVERCLAPVPADRFAGASAVEEALASTRSAVLDDEDAPATVATGPAAGVLRRVSSAPRNILIRSVGNAAEDPLARGLRYELANRINEHALLCAFDDPERAHEASAHLELTHRGDVLVLDVRVLGSREGFEFWRASFEGTTADAIDLARAAARGIEQALAVDVQEGSAMKPLGPRASELYFAGRAFYKEYWPEPLRLAIESFEEALVHAPSHPLLISALASACARQGFFTEGHMERARETAELAVRLAPDLAEAHVAKATAHLQDADLEGAVVALLRAVELAPGHTEALGALGRVLLEVGAPADSIRLSEASHLRDRDDWPLAVIARAQALLGRWDAAMAALDRMGSQAEKQLGLMMKARISMWRRDRHAVKAIYDRATALGLNRNSVSHRLMYIVGEAVLEMRTARAQDLFVREERAGLASRTRRTFVYQLSAEANAYVGDLQGALEAIERAVKEGLVDTFWLDRCPLFDDLRGSDGFEAAREIVQCRARRVLALLHTRRFDV